ncbi:MAG: hypothetical protein RL754_659 [Bacteroidota bacterium]
MITIGLYLVVGMVLAQGIIRLKKPFFALAKKSVSLLNVLVSDVDEDEKIDALSAQIGTTVVALLKVLGLLIAMLGVSYGLWFGVQFLLEAELVKEKETFGSYSMVALAVGSILPFLKKSKSTSAYSDLAQLFHHLVLDNYHLGRRLLERQIKGVEKPDPSKINGVIITGLARAGTTALTRELAARGPFSSLDYSNMPVLLAPRLWGRIYKPKKVEDQERAHGDGIKVGLASVEALEEYFFKVVLNDRYIQKEGVIEHDLSEVENSLYRRYQESIRQPGCLYLAKNNNCITRYQSLTALNPDLKVYIMLRDPLQHAYSLMKQHIRFEADQQKDPFVLTYMDWLGHHEFGIGQRPFILKNAPAAPFVGDPHNLNYWLERWISYYSYVSALEAKSIILYDLFLQEPTAVMSRISADLGVDFNRDNINLFDKNAASIPNHDSTLAKRAYEVYEALKLHAL